MSALPQTGKLPPETGARLIRSTRSDESPWPAITSVIVLPGDTWHFHWAKSGEYVTQVSAIGPLGLEYHDVRDDPRHDM